MSGAEALFVIGLLANAIQIVDFTAKLFERIRESGSKLNDAPKAFQNVAVTLPLLANILGKSKQQVAVGLLDEATCKALRHILEDCHAKLEELKCIFDACLPRDGSSKVKRGWKAVLSLGQDKKVEQLSQILSRHVQLLTYHHVASPSNSDIQQKPSKTSTNPTPAMSAGDRSKAHFIVPVYWADDFIGRGDELDKLNSRLCQSAKHSRLSIVGLGGIGKTRLSLQYAAQHKQSDISVFWIHAATAERIKSASRDIARKVGISGWNNPKLDVLALLKDWFESDESGRWLIIYDNAEDVDLLYGSEPNHLARYFPRSDRGSILLTTRNKQIGVRFATLKNVLKLSAMTDAESSALLSARLGEDDLELPDRLYLSRALEGVPLALVQAISFITENESTVARYLELYNESDASKIDLLSRDFEDDIRDTEVKNPIAVTWMVTFDYIKEHRALAADLLCLMSMFDTQAIPETLIRTIKNSHSPDILIDQALGTLHAYSMISSRQAQAISREQSCRLFDLHRLVRLTTRRWLVMRSEFNYWTAEAIDVMSTKIEHGVLNQDASSALKYVPHALTLLHSQPLELQGDTLYVPAILAGHQLQDGHTEKGVICPTCTADLVRGLAHHYGLADDNQKALSIIRQSIAIDEKVHGPHHEATLFGRSLEVIFLRNLGDTVRAEQCSRELTVACTSAHGEWHPRTISAKTSLAARLSDSGLHAEAEESLSQMMTFFIMKYEDDDELVLDVKVTLSRILFLQGRVEEANLLNGQVSEQAKTPSVLRDLACSYELQMDNSKAESLYLRMLGFEEETLNKTSGVGDVLLRLGRVYFHQERYEEAEDCFRRAYIIYKGKWGEHHKCTMPAMSGLLLTFIQRRRYGKAEELQYVLLQITKVELGNSHTEILALMWVIAMTQLLQAKVRQSRSSALAAAIATKNALGDDNDTFNEGLRWMVIGWGFPMDVIIAVLKPGDQASNKIDDDQLSWAGVPGTDLVEEELSTRLHYMLSDELSAWGCSLGLRPPKSPIA